MSKSRAKGLCLKVLKGYSVSYSQIFLLAKTRATHPEVKISYWLPGRLVRPEDLDFHGWLLEAAVWQELSAVLYISI